MPLNIPTSAHGYWSLYLLSPLMAFLVIGLSSHRSSSVFFWFHPFCMAIAVLVCVSIAVQIKKCGGYRNTMIHMIMMSIAVFLFVVGLATIVVHKSRINLDGTHPHFDSIHSKFGVATLAIALILFLVGTIGLNPISGLFRSSGMLRMTHKIGGRIHLVIMFTTVFLGFKSLHDGETTMIVLITLGLITVLGLLLILPPPKELMPLYEEQTDNAEEEAGDGTGIGRTANAR